ncbi:virion structural protein [Acaryochloris phage A-HIS2]|nr:virion structural protein [Acaryochloris phage A-HIS2]
MALTDLQKSRIKFHLGLSEGEPSITALLQDRGLLLDSLSQAAEDQIIGDIVTDPADPTHLTIAGNVVAQQGSILGNLEKCFQNLSPDIVDPSTFVYQAGDVKLNPNEFRNRGNIYEYWRELLARILNYQVIPDNGYNYVMGRVGYY